MKKEIKKVPTIRFKEFTDDWEQRKLGDISEIKTGPFGSTLHAEDYVSSGVPIITTEHFKNGELPLEMVDLPQVSQKDYKRLGSYVLNEGDIVFSRVGSVDINALVTPFQKHWLFSGRVLRVRSNKDIDSRYLHYVLSTESVKENIKARAVGQTMPSINTEILKETAISLVSNIDEQKKISTLLNSLDKTITLHQRKLKQLQTLKKYFLQNMFPAKGEKVPTIRFKGFTGDWKTCKFGDVFKDVKSGLSRMLSNFDIGLPVIRANNICDGKLDLKSDIRYWYKIDPQGVNTYNYLVNKDDILINFINSEAKMGTAAYVEDIPCRETIYTTNILRCRTFSDINSKFIFFLTFTQSYKNYIKSITKPAINQASFTTVDFKKYKILIPDIKEQIMISNLLTHVDNRITLQQRKLDQLQSLKKFMLQNLFI